MQPQLLIEKFYIKEQKDLVFGILILNNALNCDAATHTYIWNFAAIGKAIPVLSQLLWNQIQKLHWINFWRSYKRWSTV